MTSNIPDVSVIMAIDQQRERSALALGALIRQTMINRMEILLFDCGAPGMPPLEGSDHPAVQVIPTAHPIIFGNLYASAVRRARGAVVIMTEEHSISLPTWVECLFMALQEDRAVAGGQTLNGNHGLGTSDIAGLMGFLDWMPPARPGEIALVDGHNGAYKRSVLLQYDAELEQMLENEIAMQMRLRRDGYRIILEPSAQYFHMNETTLRSLCRGYYLWNRCLAATRRKLMGWSVPKTGLIALGLPFQPWLRSARLGLKIITKHRQYVGQYLRSLPLILIALYSAAGGQAAGLLFGGGHAPEDYANFSLNESRAMPNRSLDEWLAIG